MMRILLGVRICSGLQTDLTLLPTVGIAYVGSASVKRGLFCGESLQRSPHDSTDALCPALYTHKHTHTSTKTNLQDSHVVCKTI